MARRVCQRCHALCRMPSWQRLMLGLMKMNFFQHSSAWRHTHPRHGSFLVSQSSRHYVAFVTSSLLFGLDFGRAYGHDVSISPKSHSRCVTSKELRGITWSGKMSESWKVTPTIEVRLEAVVLRGLRGWPQATLNKHDTQWASLSRCLAVAFRTIPLLKRVTRVVIIFFFKTRIVYPLIICLESWC